MVTLMPSSMISFAAVAIAMQARGALSVDRHAGDAGRKSRPQQRLSRDIAALGSLLEGCAHHHVVDLARIDGCALQARSRSHGRPAFAPACR